MPAAAVHKARIIGTHLHSVFRPLICAFDGKIEAAKGGENKWQKSESAKANRRLSAQWSLTEKKFPSSVGSTLKRRSKSGDS
jgi:hypothetical protein